LDDTKKLINLNGKIRIGHKNLKIRLFFKKSEMEEYRRITQFHMPQRPVFNLPSLLDCLNPAQNQKMTRNSLQKIRTGNELLTNTQTDFKEHATPISQLMKEANLIQRHHHWNLRFNKPMLPSGPRRNVRNAN
jgi:uncharacterized protein (DUF2225 family)